MISMKGKRVLYVSGEVSPYISDSETGLMSFEAARRASNQGIQTRIFMPRFGIINERRHQLHEVIRLSGMNLVINDVDVPLMIKVASVPKERMQVYFIDNEEYFKRKGKFGDENNVPFPDNDERAIFFVKGVLETVKRLNWSPDIIHVHGWMAALLPLYLKEHYKDDPTFKNSKIVTSLYEKDLTKFLSDNLFSKINFDAISAEKAQTFQNTDEVHLNVLKSAIENSDGIIQASEGMSKVLEAHIAAHKKPILDFDLKDYPAAYLNFYSKEVMETS